LNSGIAQFQKPLFLRQTRDRIQESVQPLYIKVSSKNFYGYRRDFKWQFLNGGAEQAAGRPPAQALSCRRQTNTENIPKIAA
jgi:hypothetical protein